MFLRARSVDCVAEQKLFEAGVKLNKCSHSCTAKNPKQKHLPSGHLATMAYQDRCDLRRK
jgi:hypothetical protein